MNQLWIINDDHLGPYPIGLERSHAELHRPMNVAFFCPLCGDIWARRVVEGGDPQWVLWNRLCKRHPSSISRGCSGSVWQNYDTEYLTNMPLDLLRREFLLHMETIYDNTLLPAA